MQTQSIRLSEAIHEWSMYATVELGHSRPSIKRRVIRLDNFLDYLADELDVTNPLMTQIEIQYIRSFMAYLVNERGNCAQTVRGYLQCLRALYNYCMENGYVKDSPAHRVKMPKKNPPARALVSDEEELRMFAACKLLRPDFRSKMASAILAVYCYAGLRTMELLSLKVSDISLEGRDCFIQISCGKGGKRRVIPMHREGIQFVKDYLAVRPNVTHDWLWVVDKRRSLRERGLAKLFSDVKWFARIERPDVKPHALRHKYATRKLRDGVNLYHIKELLGHSHIETTIGYLHSDLQQLTDAAQKGGLRSGYDS